MLKTISRIHLKKFQNFLEIRSRPPVAVSSQTRFKHSTTRQQIVHQESLKDPAAFWSDVAMDIKWKKFPTQIYQETSDGLVSYLFFIFYECNLFISCYL